MLCDEHFKKHAAAQKLQRRNALSPHFLQRKTYCNYIFYNEKAFRTSGKKVRNALISDDLPVATDCRAVRSSF
jgi:hypothetical protein